MTPRLLTPHQSQYYAWLLTRRAAGDSVESLASTLVDSQVDLNPHQVEAGLVISQRWAERRHRVLMFDRQDEVKAERNDLIGQLEAQLEQRVDESTLFTVEWEMM
ncbi:hypothetical protein AGMMS50225_03570 [Betaproteobacteria bacterium]|nr:hypothetical protein AGMMS50225_03570 [Betaproteobacteria bacterium]